MSPLYYHYHFLFTTRLILCDNLSVQIPLWKEEVKMTLMRKKLFGYLFIIILILSLRITAAYAGTNGRTQAQAVAWAYSQEGQTLEYPDSGLDDPCFDFICCYYQELGQEIPWKNADPSGSGGDFCPAEWQYADSPQPGDVAVWLSDDNDHAAIVTEIRGAQMVCAEQNYDGKMYVSVNLHDIDAYTYIHPDFPANQGSPIRGGSRTVSDGDYHIVSALNADMGLDVAGNRSADGTNVQLYHNVTDPNQVFTVQYLSNGFYKITHKRTRKVLDVSGAGLAYGTNVDIYSSNDTDAQMWRIDPSENPGFLNITAKCNGLCLDVDGAKAQNGTNIKTYRGNGSNAQGWRFIAVGENQTVADGDYHIVSALNPVMGMDVAGNNSNNATNIQLYANAGDEKQVFTVKYLEDGYYQIIHKDSGKSIDLAGNRSLSGTNLDIYQSNSTDAQKWIIKSAGNGSYNIIGKGSGLYIDVDQASTQNGTNIQGYVGNGSGAQQWLFVPADTSDVNSADNIGYWIYNSFRKYKKYLKDPTDATFNTFQLKSKKVGNTSITTGWKAVPRAAGYTVFAAPCGSNFSKLTDTTGTSYTQKNLQKGTYYKYFVAAHDKNGIFLAFSNAIHVATAGGSEGNPESVSLNKKNVSLEMGGTFDLKAKLENGDQQVSKHREIAFESDNPRVATVTKSGTIKAVGTGTCNVYAYAQNGVFARCTVTVN